MPRALPQIELDAAPDVRAALRSLGRTEDVRLAPGGRRIAIACYWRNEIAIGELELARGRSGPTAALTSLELLPSPFLDETHGLDWRDDETLVVASRTGGVTPFRLADGGLVPLSPPAEVNGAGSVAVRPLGDGTHEVLVCENWRNVVSRLLLDGGGTLREAPPVQQVWLDLPDGIALGEDARWLAVSNHNTHTVLVFDRETSNGGDPVAVLRGVDYPHGVRFTAHDRLLVVADAGAPYVHVFVRPGDRWHGAAFPVATVAVMDDATFRRGRHNPMEGGPKGIDVDTTAGVMLVTCEEAPLAIFDAAELLERPEQLGVDAAALVRHELDALTAVAREREETERVRAELSAVVSTRAWRLTGPARRLYGRLRRVDARARRADRAAAREAAGRETADVSG